MLLNIATVHINYDPDLIYRAQGPGRGVFSVIILQVLVLALLQYYYFLVIII